MIKFNIPYYILMYPDGSFVGVDKNSGGYPYPTKSIAQCEYWQSYEKVLQYQHMFLRDKFSIHKVVGFHESGE